MWAPTKSKAFFCVAQQFQLGIHRSRRDAGVLRPIPNHDPPVCAHCCNHVGVLRLVSRLVDFALVVNLLHNIELHFHRALLGAATVATNFPALFIVVFGFWVIRIGKLYVRNLQVVFGIA